MSKIEIEFWGDTNCPFCYLGDLALKEAIAESPYTDMILVKFHACQLHPELDEDTAVNFEKMLSNEIQDHILRDKKLAVMDRIAKQRGVSCHVKDAWVVQSSNALRLLKWICDTTNGCHEKVLSLMAAFGKAFFSDAKKLNDEDTLLNCVGEIGLNISDAKRVLGSDMYLKEIIEDQKRAAEKCPNFIPSLYFNGTDLLDGVLKSEDILARITNAHSKSLEENHTDSVSLMGLDSCGDVCDK